MKLKAVALGIADCGAPSAATALRPAAADLILLVDAELTDEIEIVTVAGTAKRKIDFTLRPPARSVSGVATDALRCTILWTQRSSTGPTPSKFGKGT